jgi:hypothetical protein
MTWCRQRMSARAAKKQIARLKAQNLIRHISPAKGEHWDAIES